MGYTSEQRDSLSTPLCLAKKKNGTLCRAFAGQGTDHLGIGRCKYHGGATSSHKKHARAVEIQRQMIVLSEPSDTDPLNSLLELHSRAAGQVSYAFQRIKDMTPDDFASAEGQMFLKMYTDERERLARIAEVCARAGIEDKLLKIQERQFAVLVRWFDEILGSLDLTERQLDRLPAAIDAAQPILEGKARVLPAA
jgi:methylphosphotriester-DNA--protein-cysteine methyltransferase